jgi:hypothetical protein
MTTDDPRFTSLITKYVNDPSNRLLHHGREVERLQIESKKQECYVGWSVRVHYVVTEKQNFYQRLANPGPPSSVTHRISLEQLMGWMWVTKS